MCVSTELISKLASTEPPNGCRIMNILHKKQLNGW